MIKTFPMFGSFPAEIKQAPNHRYSTGGREHLFISSLRITSSGSENRSEAFSPPPFVVSIRIYG